MLKKFTTKFPFIFYKFKESILHTNNQTSESKQNLKKWHKNYFVDSMYYVKLKDKTQRIEHMTYVFCFRANKKIIYEFKKKKKNLLS
jgi:RNA polymerase-binding transcription factor DksA